MEKNIIRYEGETIDKTIYGNQGAMLSDRTAAKTSIDFLLKYTAQLKIQLIKRRVRIAAADLDFLPQSENCVISSSPPPSSLQCRGKNKRQRFYSFSM